MTKGCRLSPKGVRKNPFFCNKHSFSNSFLTDNKLLLTKEKSEKECFTYTLAAKSSIRWEFQYFAIKKNLKKINQIKEVKNKYFAN